MIEKDALHAAFLEWSKRNDMLPMDKAHFCEAVIAAGNGRIRPSKPVVGDRQVPHLVGIRLRFTNRPEVDDADWEPDLPF